MKNILTNFYDQIRDKVFVSEIIRSYISLTKRGNEYSGLCPFHGEKTPSFTVNDQKKFYHCFGCGAHGDVIKFESEQSGVSYKDAAYKIASKFSITPPTFSETERKEMQMADKMADLMQEACNFFVKNMSPGIREILNARGITNETIDSYKIGYAKKSSLIEHFANIGKTRLEELAMCGLVSKKDSGKYYEFFSGRITIPIISTFGKIIGFGARSTGEEMPKYINSPETLLFKKGEALFGENIAYSSAYKTGSVILVEGYFDVIALHQKGFKNAVASLGTAVTNNQVNKLWKIANEVIICLDGDAAGLRAAKKVVDVAIESVSATKKLSFISMPSNMDPDELVSNYGAKNFQTLIENRLSLSEFIFKEVVSGKRFDTAENRATIEAELDTYLLKLQDANLKQNMRRYFSQKLWDLFDPRKKKLGQVTAKQNNNLSIQTTSVIENIDDLILSFIINHSRDLSPSHITQAIEAISQTSKRNELLEYVQTCIEEEVDNILDEPYHLSKLQDNIKKTRFCDEYEILCQKYRRSFVGLNIQSKLINVLEYLLLKRYLHLLTEEFKNIMNIKAASIEEKASFYLNEIKSIQQKINNFDMGFLDQ